MTIMFPVVVDVRAGMIRKMPVIRAAFLLIGFETEILRTDEAIKLKSPFGSGVERDPGLHAIVALHTT